MLSGRRDVEIELETELVWVDLDDLAASQEGSLHLLAANEKTIGAIKISESEMMSVPSDFRVCSRYVTIGENDVAVRRSTEGTKRPIEKITFLGKIIS